MDKNPVMVERRELPRRTAWSGSCRLRLEVMFFSCHVWGACWFLGMQSSFPFAVVIRPGVCRFALSPPLRPPPSVARARNGIRVARDPHAGGHILPRVRLGLSCIAPFVVFPHPPPKTVWPERPAWGPPLGVFWKLPPYAMSVDFVGDSGAFFPAVFCLL